MALGLQELFVQLELARECTNTRGLFLYTIGAANRTASGVRMLQSRNDDQPLHLILQRLTDERHVSIPLLFRFSDMTHGEMNQFTTWWPAQADDRRTEIAQHLADISEENFEVDFSPVFEILLRDPNHAVRYAALDGLWDTTNIALVPTILRLTEEDPTLEVRVAATKTLAHFVMMGVWGQISSAIKDRVIDWLIPLFNDPSTPLPVRCAAIEALGPADRDEIEELIRAAYNDHSPEMQASALFAMGTSADAAWLNIILEELDNPFLAIRLEAVRATGEIGEGDAVGPLANQLLDEEYPDVREAIVTALGRIGDDAARRVLRECRDDPDMQQLRPAVDAAFEQMSWDSMSFDLADIPLAYDDEDEDEDDDYDLYADEAYDDFDDEFSL